MEKKCCICGKEFDGFGNNPEPIMSGCCCDECNQNFVVPLRLYHYTDATAYRVVKSNHAFNTTSELLKSQDFEYTGTMSLMSFFHNPETDEDVVLIPGYVNKE